MNIAVCVKQIPDPAVPGKLDADHTLDRVGQAASSTTPTATASRWRSSSPTRRAAARSSSSRWRRTARCRACAPALAMGAAKAVLVSDDALAGSDALSTAKVLAKAVERAGDVDLVLTATESTDGYTGTIPGAGRRAARLAVAHVRQARRGRRRQGHHPAPDRGRLRRGRGVAARGRERDRRCGRAAVPVVQGDHGGEEQAGRPGDRRPTSASSADEVGWAGARQTDRVGRRRARARGRREDRGRRRGVRAHRRVPRAAQGHLSQRTDAEQSPRTDVDEWQFPRSGCSPRPTATSRRRATLELLTKARELGDTVEAVLRRARTPTRSRRGLGEHGATKVYAVDPGDALAGRRRRGRARSRSIGRAPARPRAVRAELRRPRRASRACR